MGLASGRVAWRRHGVGDLLGLGLFGLRHGGRAGHGWGPLGRIGGLGCLWSRSPGLIQIIRKDDERRTDLPFQLGVDSTNDRDQICIRHCNGEGLDRFNVVVDLNPTILNCLRWGDLDGRPRIVADDLNF